MTEQIFRQPSVMNAQQHFSQVPSADIPRSKFDRSHALKTTFDAGRIIPIYVDEVLPGDTHTVNVHQLSRLATPMKPIMDNIYQDTHFWFVPNRLLWLHWPEFMGERLNPDDDPNDFSIPQTTIALGSISPSSVAGYFGLPKRTGTVNVSVSALYFRAYSLIWNEWYREQTLQDRAPFSNGNGPDDWSAFVAADSCYPRGKRKDYFTSCLPWPQKGDPVTVPLGDIADIVIPNGQPMTGNAFVQSVRDLSGSELNGGGLYVDDGASGGPLKNNPGYTVGGSPVQIKLQGSSPSTGALIYNVGGAYVDLSTATSVTINDLRTAFQVQKMLERDARGGTRYIEMIFAQFGVKSDDARLQRPEYLGGSTTNVNINPVASTAPTVSGTPQGNLAAFGTAVGKAGFTKSFTEHGVIIGVTSARADLTYQQGLDKLWTRKTRVEHYLPVYAHLGEQAVLNKEIFVQGTSADDEVFGYQERWAEYRYKLSRITGLFSSEQSTSLDAWHLSQEFATLPVLNDEFIVENPPIDRVIAVPSEPHFLADFWFSVQSSRAMPVYSDPGLIDHF